MVDARVGDAPAPAPRASRGGRQAFQPMRVAGELPDLLRQMGVDVEPNRDRQALMDLAQFVSGSMKNMAGIAEVLAGIIMGIEQGPEGSALSMRDLMDHVKFTRMALE